jgi:hypothetical protein
MSRYNPQRRGTARTLPNFCVVLCIVCVQMCTVLLPPGGYPIAVNKYIISYYIRYVGCVVTQLRVITMLLTDVLQAIIHTHGTGRWGGGGAAQEWLYLFLTSLVRRGCGQSHVQVNLPPANSHVPQRTEGQVHIKACIVRSGEQKISRPHRGLKPDRCGP